MNDERVVTVANAIQTAIMQDIAARYHDAGTSSPRIDRMNPDEVERLARVALAADADGADETKEAHPRSADIYLEAMKKAECEAMELRAALAQCRADNDRLKAEASAQPIVNIFIGGRASDE